MSPVKYALVLIGAALLARAEEHTLTLAQALDIAAHQNPDITLSRLDERRSQDDVRLAKDPFLPKVYGGSGLAWTYGYPNSIEGNAPSLFQMKTQEALFNRPDKFKLAAARELSRGSEFGSRQKEEDVAYQTADLFLTASETEHEVNTLEQQLPSLQKVVDIMTASVAGGSELPLEQKRASVNLALSRERMDAAKLDADYYEMMLAVALGYPATDRVKPVDSEPPQLMTPSTETEAADLALKNSKELRQMQSNVLAKELDLRSYKSAWLPQVDLVAQYALFLKQNYQNYFQKFQRNNTQLGASITIPLLLGSASKAQADQAVVDLTRMRVQMDQIRNRIISSTRRNYEQWQKAVSIRDLSRMQLDLARESLTVLLAQNGEGRVPIRQVEQARLEESDRWIALYEAETQVTRTQLAILRQMGTLLASVRGATAGNQP